MKTSDSLVKTAMLMLILTLGSKILGFIREMALAAFFGTSYIVDSYVMAYSIPNILFAAIFVAIGTAYMPLLAKKTETVGFDEGNIFTSQIIRIITVCAIITTVIGILFSEQLVSIMARGFEEKRIELTSFYLKITLLYMLFTALMSIFENYLQYKKVFLPQIIIDYVQNIAVIVAIVVSAYFDHHILAFGLLVGYALRCLILYRAARRKGFKYNSQNEGMKNTISAIIPLAIPVFFGTVTQQLNVFVDRTCASTLKEGSIAALNYANQIDTIVLTLTITILTTLIYPRLAEASALGNYENLRKLLQRGIRVTLIVALPIALGIIVYNQEIVQIIYQRGAFDNSASSMTAIALVFYSMGLLFLGLNELITRAYYALHEMKTPMVFAVISMLINVILNLILVNVMQHAGLAFATSISAMTNTVLLILGFKKKFPRISLIDSRSDVIKIIFGSIISIMSSFFFYNTVLIKYIQITLLATMIAVIVAVVVYIVVLYFLKLREAKEAADILKKKLSK